LQKTGALIFPHQFFFAKMKYDGMHPLLRDQYPIFPNPQKLQQLVS